MEEDENLREQLYKQFCNSLKKPVGERFFDEDELVELFDYAGDLGDEYIRMEVLFCAARLYPESQQLAERRAILYGDIGETGFASRFFDDNMSVHSCLWDLSRLQNNAESITNGNEALDYICGSYDMFNDEEAIRIVKVADNLDCYDWIIANLDLLRRKVNYLPSLLYEVATVSERRDNNAFAIKLLDELVNSEPFSAVFWALLYRLHLKEMNLEEAANAFEYARALVGDDNETKLFIVETSANSSLPERIAPQVLELSKEVIDSMPDDYRAYETHLAILMNHGELTDAHTFAENYFKKHSDNASVLVSLFYLDVDNMSEYVDIFSKTGATWPFDSAGMKEILNNLVQMRNGGALVPFLRLAENFRLLDHDMYLSVAVAYFDIRFYAGCLKLMDVVKDWENVIAIPNIGVRAMLAYIISVFAMEPGEKPLELSRRYLSVLSNAPTAENIGQTAERQYLAIVCHDIIRMLEENKSGAVDLPLSLRPYFNDDSIRTV